MHLQLRRRSSTRLFNYGKQQTEGSNSRRGVASVKANAFPDWPLMAVLVHNVQQLDAQREIITNKSIWHLSEEAIKNVYTFYIMFTCWGCLFFGSTKQEDIEESARAELWREELIEEIEQKVGGLRELEEAGRK
ncbi:NDH dependent flow 6 isoform 2 [Theobroma cacao]|uniref:NDH dependent flow 6 isoform 2 n=1 Tax=Theobroma cacao TaxID=3641 RepID=A0A061FXU7_THECC|nr:NDH dependent flow 6 isoform 2 [Theobroma cacao]